MTRRPYADCFTAEAPRPFLIATTTVGRRGSKGFFSAADRVSEADQLSAFMPYNDRAERRRDRMSRQALYLHPWR